MLGMKNFLKHNWGLIIIFLISLIIRIGFSLYTDFSNDEAKCFYNGFNFFVSGQLSPYGADIVYSDTKLPGSIMSILIGLPLYFSNGLPYGTAIFIAIWNFAAMLLLFWLFLRLFPSFNRYYLATFLLFAPWTILHVAIWNPSYLPLFAVLFFIGLYQVFIDPHHFGGHFLIFFTIPIVMQLHLSFVLLIAILGLCFILKWYKPKNIPAILTGLILGSLTLLPYLLQEKVSSGAKGEFLLANIKINWDNLFNFPKFLFRLLTFPTGETSIFFLRGKISYPEAWDIISNKIYLLPFILLGLILSILIITLSLYFYWNRIKFFIQKPIPSKFSLLERFDFIVVAITIITYFSFFFSIKGPSAHTYWLLMPISFYPLLRSLQLKQDPLTNKTLKFPLKKVAFIIYIVSVNYYSIHFHFLYSGLVPLHPTIKKAQALYPNEILEASEREAKGIAAIYKVLDWQSQKNQQ